MRLTCRWRLLVSTCLLVWSFSSLFITHRLLKNDQKKTEALEDSTSYTKCYNDSGCAGRKRQIVEGWFDFQGELMKVPDIDEEGADGFSKEPTEFGMQVGVGRHDSDFQYLIYDQVLVGRKYLQLSLQTGVTLVTQSSVERLHWLVESSTTWTGPMSVVVFVPDKEFDVAQVYISYLRSCYSNIRDNVAWSLVHPVTKPPKASNINIKTIVSCSEQKNFLESLVSSLYSSKEYSKWRTGYDYPQNHLRNVARDNSLSHYSLSLDVDVILSPGMTTPLAKFLNGNTCVKCAFVIPTYEIHHAVPRPANKSQLLELIADKKAQPFHSKIFVHNQFATNFSRFERKQDDSVVHISHNVTNYEFFYEPFYVSLDTAPRYDERFVGYGFTRNTQSYELYLAGWQFLVLSPVFSIHWGILNKKGRPTWRERQNSNNRRKFPHFKKELFSKYNLDYSKEREREKEEEMKLFQQPKPLKGYKMHFKRRTLKPD